MSSDVRQAIWMVVGAVLLGLLAGGLALWATRLAGTVMTAAVVGLLSAIYATGIAAGLLVATAAVSDYE